MDMSFFWKGILLGFAIALPVGPIGILCIRRTLQFGRFSGLFSGLGAALADAIYAIIAAFGLTFISDALLAYQMWLRAIGGLFLLYLGWRMFRAKAYPPTPLISHTSLLKDAVSSFLLTITNPMTVISFLAMFAGFGLVSVERRYDEASFLVAGVFLGSMFWWLLLSEGMTLFRKRVSARVMQGINRVAGILLVIFGIVALASILQF